MELFAERLQFLLRKCNASIGLSALLPSSLNHIQRYYAELFELIRQYVATSLTESRLNTLYSVLARELLHSEDYTYFDSLRASYGDYLHGRSDIFYLTSLNINIVPFRRKAGINTQQDSIEYALRALLRFAVTAYASLQLARQSLPSLKIYHILAVDTEPFILRLVEAVFASDSNLYIVPVDLSSYEYASDSVGLRPSHLFESIAQSIESLVSHEPERHVVSVNLDADDIISPIHPGLLEKYIRLLPARSVKPVYACFPTGLQLKAHSGALYSYTGCSNCFMACITSSSTSPRHIWYSAHDRLPSDSVYKNVQTWYPVWAECIWSTNINNSVWPSSLPLSSPLDNEAFNMLYSVQLSLVQILRDALTSNE
jgi:hypothetical protein